MSVKPKSISLSLRDHNISVAMSDGRIVVSTRIVKFPAPFDKLKFALHKSVDSKHSAWTIAETSSGFALSWGRDIIEAIDLAYQTLVKCGIDRMNAKIREAKAFLKNANYDT